MSCWEHGSGISDGSDRFRWYAFDGLGSVLGELAEPVYDEELGHDTVHLVATNDKDDVTMPEPWDHAETAYDDYSKGD